MTVTRERRFHANGVDSYWHFTSDDPNKTMMLTGPLSGRLVVNDGTEYNVGPEYIEVEPHHVGELSHLIGLKHEEDGHPDHLGPDDESFVHHCTELCGEFARPITHPLAAQAAERAQRQTNAIPDADVRAHHAAALGTGSAPGGSMALAGVAAENAALNGLDGTGSTNVIPDVSLHTATPGTTGASENANSGSYARQACSWNAAASGAKTNSTSLTFSTGGSVAVTHIGTWSSATYGAGNYAIGGALASPVTAASIAIASGAISLSAG